MGRSLALIAAMACAVSLHAQTAEPKTAEQVYKNITALKGTPADQLVPSMQFISSSLGVQCGFCHVEGKPEADDKGAKRTARQMMAMTGAINKDSFRGNLQVTCYSCHRGSARPVNTPPVLESDAAPAPPAAPAPNAGAAAPNADQIIEHYVTALGGADAMRKTTSRAMKGVILVNGNESAIELLTKAPNKRMSISQTPAGSSYTVFDGTAGWLGTTGRPARDMSQQDAESASLDAEFYLGLRLKEMFQGLRPGRPETINGTACYALTGTRQGKPPVRLYFDQNSGLLVRMVRYTDTPLGRNPVQVDYADYRDVAGVKVPFRLTLSRPSTRFTIQLKDVQANAEIDDARFAKPSGDVK